MTTFRSRLKRYAPLILVGLVPMLLLAIGNAQFILNHFFTRAPYLLDSGFYSALIYRAGISPDNPNIALNFAESYFTFHFSPFVSLFSLLSYVQPLPRIEWYALFQAIVFAPIGIATYAVTRHLEPAGALRRIPIAMVAAVAFSFSGLVLTFVSYPHYEPAIPGLVCLVLAFVTSGRIRLAWVFLVIAASVREDGGFHTAFALMPLLFLNWRGIPTSATRRQLIVMIAAACAMSVAGVVFQKLFFATTTLNHIYLGDPPFGHVSMSLIADRVDMFLANCQHIYYPFIATCLVAVLTRDYGYVLGWIVTGPWFLLNLLAIQQVKATFYTYAGIPFLVSVFWVLLYGALIAPAARRLRGGAILAVFALISLSSTLGGYRTNEVATRVILREMLVRQKWNRATVHDFVAGIGKLQTTSGHVYVDYAVASLALEWLRDSNSWTPRVQDAKVLAFHRALYVGEASMMNSLVKNKLDVCARIGATQLMACTPERLPADIFAKTEVIPAVFAFSSLRRPGITVEPTGIVLRNKVRIGGRLGKLTPGTYEIRVQVDGGPNLPPGKLADLEVITTDIPLIVETTTDVPELVARFTVDGTLPTFLKIRGLNDSPLTIKRVQLRLLTSDQPAP